MLFLAPEGVLCRILGIVLICMEEDTEDPNTSAQIFRTQNLLHPKFVAPEICCPGNLSPRIFCRTQNLSHLKFVAPEICIVGISRVKMVTRP